MLEREYLFSVNRLLYLPPYYRLKELNILARQFLEGSALGQSPEEVIMVLGSPKEAAENIQMRYPEYRESGFRRLGLMLALAGLWEQWCQYILKTIDPPEFLIDPEYIIAADKNAAAGNTISFFLGSGHTPGEIRFLSIAAILIGLFIYFFFKYTPVHRK